MTIATAGDVVISDYYGIKNAESFFPNPDFVFGEFSTCILSSGLESTTKVLVVVYCVFVNVYFKLDTNGQIAVDRLIDVFLPVSSMMAMS